MYLESVYEPAGGVISQVSGFVPASMRQPVLWTGSNLKEGGEGKGISLEVYKERVFIRF